MIELYLNYTNEVSNTLEFSYKEDFNAGNEFDAKYINSGIWDAVVHNAFKFLSLVSLDTLKFNTIIDIKYEEKKGARLLKNVFLAPFSNHDTLIINPNLRVYRKLDGDINEDLLIYTDYAKDTFIVNNTPQVFKSDIYGILCYSSLSLSLIGVGNLNEIITIGFQKQNDKKDFVSNEVYIKSVNVKYRDIIEEGCKSFRTDRDMRYSSSSLIKKKDYRDVNLDDYKTLDIKEYDINLGIEVANGSKSTCTADTSKILFYCFNTIKEVYSKVEQFIFREYQHIPVIDDIIFLPAPERNMVISNEHKSLEHVILKPNLDIFKGTFLSESEFNLALDNVVRLTKNINDILYSDIVTVSYTNREIKINKLISLDTVLLDMYCFNSSMLERMQKKIKDSRAPTNTFISNVNHGIYIWNEPTRIDAPYFDLDNGKRFSFADKLIKKSKDLNETTIIPITDNKKDILNNDIFISIDSKNSLNSFLSKSVAAIMNSNSMRYTDSNIKIDCTTNDSVIYKNLLGFEVTNNDTFIEERNLSVYTNAFPCSYFYSEINIENIIHDIGIDNISFGLEQKAKDTGKAKSDTSLNFNSIDTYVFPDSDYVVDMNALPLRDFTSDNKYYNFASKRPLTLDIEDERVFISRRGNLTALAKTLVGLDSVIKDTNSGSLMIAVDTTIKDIGIEDLTVSLTNIIVDASYGDSQIRLSDIMSDITIKDSIIKIGSSTNDLDILNSNVALGTNIKDISYMGKLVLIDDLIKESTITNEGIKINDIINELYIPPSDMISFNIDSMLKINKQQLPVIKKLVEVKDMESLSEKLTKDDINVFMKSSVFILDKGRLDAILPAWKQINSNKILKDLMFNQGEWAYDPNGWHPDLTAGGIDELLLPQNDFDYSVFKADLLDPVTHLPIQQVQRIDDTTFIAKRPVNHPLPECSNIGRDYVDVDVNLLKLLIEQFYNIWQANIFKFGAVDMRDAVGQMLELIGAYVAYNIPDFLMPAGERIIRLMRWYGEAAIMRNAEYKIHVQYDSIKSELYNGTCTIPNTMDNMYIDMKKFSIVNQDISKDCSIEFTLENVIATTISFGVYMTNGSLGIYINDEEVDTIANSIGLISYNLDKVPQGGQNKVRFYFQNSTNNGIINLANIVVKDYVYSDMYTEYSPSLGTGNKVLDEMTKSIAVYADLYDNNTHFMQDTINGNLAVTDLIDQLQRYFFLHHDKKSKGKRLITKT